MGYNTVVVLLNDHQHRIAEDGPIGRRIADAMSAWWSSSRGRQPDLNFNAGSVISCDHADGEQVVIVHGNCGQRAQDADHLGGQALDAMKGCLERHGYKVTKPRKPKPIAATPAPEGADHG